MRTKAGLVIVRLSVYGWSYRGQWPTCDAAVVTGGDDVQVERNVTLVPYEKEHVEKYHE